MELTTRNDIWRVKYERPIGYEGGKEEKSRRPEVDGRRERREEEKSRKKRTRREIALIESGRQGC